MKIQIRKPIVALFLLSTLNLPLSTALAQGTTFTFQGRLNESGSPANSTNDFTFTLFTSSSGFAVVGTTSTVNDLAVSNGSFSVTLDFGGSAFTGPDRWLEIGVRPGASSGPYTTLTPRQKLTPSPYAIFAGGANATGIAGTLSDAQVPANIPRLNGTPTFTGDVTIANPYDLNFGSTTRQMLNLWNANYGIGVQNNTLYQRSDGGFAWFRLGTHTNNVNHPGTGGTNLMWLDGTGNLTLNASLTLDVVSSNNGSYYPGLVFGAGSGETISSKRTSGGNQYGIDFYTGFNPRLSIANNGNVGIGTVTAQSKLEIVTGAGNVQIRNDGGFTPALNLIGGSNPGILRLRNALEIWPSDTGGRSGYLDVRDTSGIATIALNGQSGEATVKVLNITGGADIAEPFQIAEPEVAKGSVVVIDDAHPGQLKLSDRAYDTRVAGIVSGANGIKPGLALHQEGVVQGGQHVALTGRVYALADATSSPIRPGDLLTTSDSPGHVMKSADRERGTGAILGKAMTGLEGGKGMVLVLVSLQ
jgi:hypothetical protein